MPDPTYRTGEAYAITGPCSMASPCPGPDAPRDQHGAGCPLSATATLMQHETVPGAMTPDLAELRRLLDGGPLRPWTAGTVDGVDYGAVWGAVTKRDGIYVTPMIVDDMSSWPGTAELIAAAVNALPALLDAADERDALRAERDALAAAVERVRALHRPEGRHDLCGTCAYVPWPCATYRALDGKARR